MARQTESGDGGSGAPPKGPALAILATAPRPGLVLRDLCPPLRPAEAAALQTAWLKQIVQALPEVAVVLFGRPVDAMPMLRYFAGPGVALREWRSGAAGPAPEGAMAHAAMELLAEGYGPVVVRTADTPDPRPADLLACVEAARRGELVVAGDQRGSTWLVGLPAAAQAEALLAAARDLRGLPAALARMSPDRPIAIRRGPWARTVQNPDDLALLLHERRPPGGEAPALPVRDLQAALRFYEVVFAGSLAAQSRTAATVTFAGAAVQLVARGSDFLANGLCVRSPDLAALAARAATHGCIGPGDGLAIGVGGGSDFTATDQDGNRLTFVGAAPAR